MGWQLKIESDEYLSLTTPTPYHQNLPELTFEVDYIIDTGSTSVLYFVKRTGSAYGQISLSPGNFNIQFGNSQTTFAVPYEADGLAKNIRVTRDSAGLISCFYNSTLIGTRTKTIVISNYPVSFISNEGGSSNLGWQLISQRLWGNSSGSGDPIFDHNPDASDHSASAPDQPILTETVSGNNATGFNMPTDGSCWVQTGSVGYTIEAVSGNYSYSGKSVGLSSSKILSALTSNYTYSGSAYLLLKDSAFYTDSTMYAQDGTSVGMLSDRLLLPNTSQYLSAGTDVSLLKNSNVTVSTGDYACTGYPVTITHSTVTNYTLDIDSGLYSSVGVELNILSGNLLVTTGGGYLVDGISVTTLLSRVLGVDTDIYNLVGTTVNIIYTPAGGYILSLANGVYQLTSDEVMLIKTNILPVARGAYASVGKSLGFMFGRVLRCSDGRYIVDGSSDTNLLVNKLITPDVGLYQYQGDLVRLKYSGVILVRVDGYRVWFESSPVAVTFKDDAVSVKFKY